MSQRGGRGDYLSSRKQGDVRPGRNTDERTMPRGRGRGRRVDLDFSYDSPSDQLNDYNRNVTSNSSSMRSSKGRGQSFRKMETDLSNSFDQSLNIKNNSTYGGGDAKNYNDDEVQVDHKSGSERVAAMKLEGHGDFEFPKGTKGKEIDLQSNYIALRCSKQGIIQYEVKFNPEVSDRRMCRKMFYEHQEELGGTVVFDGATAFAPKILPEVLVLKSKHPTEGYTVTITISYVKVPSSKDCLQVFNIIFKRVMSKLGLAQVGRNYFLPMEAKPVPGYNLEVWPGYVTSCGSYDGGVLLMMDVSHRVLRTETALEIMEDIMNQGGSSVNIVNELVGQSVLTRYNNKLYRVDDVMFDSDPMTQFTLDDGSKISYLEYYKSTYGLTIKDEAQPLLISKPKKTQGVEKVICLVPELVYMTGLTEKMRSNFKMMKELANYTKLAPQARKESMLSLVKRIKSVPQAMEELTKWGFQLDTDIYELKGRKLPSETIYFRNNEISSGSTAEWSKAIGNNDVIDSKKLSNWLFLATKRDSREAHEFIDQYTRLSRGMGLEVSEPHLVLLHDDRSETYVREIKNNFSSKAQIQLVVVLFPTRREDRYNAVKRLCCCEYPIPTQVINKRTINDPRKIRSVVQKIALQINCKLGGALWGIKIPTRSLMVCGVDVNHDTKDKRSSQLAFVSSIDPQCTRWHSKVKKQEPGEELSFCMKECFIEAIKKYYDCNNELPARIVIFRDGVGEGQLAAVRDYELGQLKSCTVDIGDEVFKPKLGYIVVQKRINTRLLATELGSRRVQNPPPGTVVDHSITSNLWYDFFIVSQHVNQGTVTPTHYVVLHDELGWDADKIQALTYKMTHLYYNWPGTIRVPAPCQYAHKLAFLVGENIKRQPNPKLNDKLYFL